MSVPQPVNRVAFSCRFGDTFGIHDVSVLDREPTYQRNDLNESQGRFDLCQQGDTLPSQTSISAMTPNHADTLSVSRSSLVRIDMLVSLDESHFSQGTDTSLGASTVLFDDMSVGTYQVAANSETVGPPAFR